MNSVNNRNHAVMSFLADRLSHQQLSFLFCVLLNFERTGDIYCRCTEFDILVCRTFIGNAIMTRNIRGIQISNFHKKYWSKSIGIAIGNTFFTRYCYWYRQYFLRQVLVLVLPILSKSIVNNPAVVCIHTYKLCRLFKSIVTHNERRGFIQYPELFI